jgi:hypothetical protein
MVIDNGLLLLAVIVTGHLQVFSTAHGKFQTQQIAS